MKNKPLLLIVLPICVVLKSCSPALIQFNEDENLVQIFEDVEGSKGAALFKS
jgi:hypothetical protein